MRTKKILQLAKGYYGRAKNCRRLAADRVYKGLEHAYRHRKEKKREFRTLWIQGIEGGLIEHNYRYSTFIHHLKLSNIELNRSVLHNMAQTEPFSFKAVVEVIRHLQPEEVQSPAGEIPAEEEETLKKAVVT